jgi:hypothetical protein
VSYLCNQKDGKDPPFILPREGVVTTEQPTANEKEPEVLKNQKKKIKGSVLPPSRGSAYCCFAQNLIFL